MLYQNGNDRCSRGTVIRGALKVGLLCLEDLLFRCGDRSMDPCFGLLDWDGKSNINRVFLINN